jgi:hypothetical protein
MLTNRSLAGLAAAISAISSLSWMTAEAGRPAPRFVPAQPPSSELDDIERGLP